MPRTHRAKTDEMEVNHPQVTIADSQPDEDHPETSTIPSVGDRPNEDGPSTSRRTACKRKQPDEEETSTPGDDRPHSSRLCNGRSNSSEVQQQNTPRIRSLSPDPVEQVRRMVEDERTAMMLQAQFYAEIVPQSSSYVGHHFSTGPMIPIDDSEDDDLEDDSDDDFDDGAIYTLTSRGLRPSHQDLDDDYDDGETFVRGLSRGEINRIPTRKYTHPNSASSSSRNEATQKRIKLAEECVVCLSDYEWGDALKTLPCCHEFHTSCIDPWLRKKQTCPICRLIVNLDRLGTSTGNN